jgi:hypothetical protein
MGVTIGGGNTGKGNEGLSKEGGEDYGKRGRYIARKEGINIDRKGEGRNVRREACWKEGRKETK